MVFDAFLRLPGGSTLIAAWPLATLTRDQFELAADLASSIGYLGRAESWAECEALAEWDGEINCGPLESGAYDGDHVRLLAPLSPGAYVAERQRIMEDMKRQIIATAKRSPTPHALDKKLDKDLRSKRRQAHTLPERLVNALTLDTADYQDRGWSRPPAAREVVYARGSAADPGVVSRRTARRRPSRTGRDLPTVARFLLAGRPRPRVEDAIRIGELMRRAALARFGWQRDESRDRWIPKAPWEISGRSTDGRPLKDPLHRHAFWLPEDADGDGWIDHVSVYVGSGMSDDIRANLDRITRLWLPTKHRPAVAEAKPGSVKEWMQPKFKWRFCTTSISAGRPGAQFTSTVSVPEAVRPSRTPRAPCYASCCQSRLKAL